MIARAGVGVAGALAVRMGVSAASQARFVCMATTANRLIQPVVAYRNLDTLTANAELAVDAARRGDYEQAATLVGRSASMMPSTIGAFRETGRLASAMGSMNPQRMRDYLTNCFAAGTPVLGEFESKPIELFRAGERVWARDENDPEGPARLQIIEETFASESEIWRLNVGGRSILTTREHPFWVVGRGWVELNALRPGDLIAGMSGEETPVHSVEPTGETLPVYNFRVEGDHTYFVGSAAWGFTLWAHNTCFVPRTDPATADRGPRIRSAFSKILLGDLGSGSVTNASARRFVKTLEAQPGDDAGHIIARVLGGRAIPSNLFPQLRNVNRGAMSALEREIAAEVRAGKDVAVRVSLRYANLNDLRPNEIVYQWRVDGFTMRRVFLN